MDATHEDGPAPAPMPVRHWALLASLYVTQYLGLGFFFVALAAILLEHGVALERLGWIYLLGLAWVLKCLWAPGVDRWRIGRLGHYRGWLLLMQGAMVATLALLAGQAPVDASTDMAMLAALCLLFSVFSATQDIAADGLAWKLLPPASRGLGNAVQVGGGLLGNLLGGGVVLMLYPTLGWGACLAVLAAATAVSLVQLLRFREPEAPPWAATPAARAAPAGPSLLWRFWQRPDNMRWLALLLVYPLGICIGHALLMPVLMDAGWTLERIGFVVNFIGSLLGLASALAAGACMRRIGGGRLLALLALAQAAAVAGLWLPLSGQGGGLAAMAVAATLLLLYSPSTVVLAALMMDRAAPDSPATDFTLQYATTFLAGSLASGAGLWIAGVLGYRSATLLAVLLALAGAALAGAGFADRRRAGRR